MKISTKILSFVLLAGVGLGIAHNTGQINLTGNNCNPGLSDQNLATSRNISLAVLQKLRANRGLINDEVCSFSDKKLARAIVKANNPKPDRPDEALAFRRLQLQDENKLIPIDGLSKAATHVKTMRSFRAKTGSIKPLVAGIDKTSWTAIGPGNIGGRVRALVIHPTNPNTMWIGSVGGGIWKTTNGGGGWSPMDDFMANLAVSTLIIDPANPDILYAGTGEGFYNADGIRGAGIFKTTNGGTNWNQLANTANPNFYYVNRLAISPDSSTILAATASGIWRSLNGGTSWTETNTLNDFQDINFNPVDNTLAIASGRNGKAYYSTDGGASWIQSTGIPKTTSSNQRIEVAYAPSNPAIVYASEWRVGGVATASQIWKSSNGGQTYIQVYSSTATGAFLGGQGWYDNIIWVDPTDETTIIVGGIDLWRSTNSGTDITKISQWYSAPNSAHADHHNIVAHPDFDGVTNRTVFFTNDGGIYKTDNVYMVGPVTGWTELNNNLAITQFYGAAGHAASGRIVGGTQDNGTLFYTGDAEAWTSPFGGDGGWSAYDPVDQNYFYGEYVYLQIHRNTTGGASSSAYIDGGLSDAGSGNTANFIAPFILDPNNANTLLAGGISLWRSSNVKAPTPSWASIKTSIGDKISAIAVAPGNSDIIWVGHNGGDVYKTINGTMASPTWNRFDATSPSLPNRYVTRITVDPVNNEIAYVTFGGFSADNVWRTDNGGTTWTDVTGSGMTGLPNVPVRSLVVHATNPNFIYVGTEVGVFASEDSGTTWSPSNDGPANVSVDELFWMGPQLVATTHGRGLFTTTPPAAPAATINPVPANNASGQLLNSSLVWTDGGGALSYNVYFGTVNPPTVAELMGNQAGTTFDPGALTVNTTYYWRIDAVNAIGTTTGVVWTFNTNNDPPVKPVLVSPTDTATGIDSTLVRFKWQPTTDPDGDTVSYQLKYCEDAALTINCGTQTAVNDYSTIMFAGLGGFSLLMFGLIGIGSTNRKNRILQILALGILVAVLTSCGGSSSSSGPDVPPVVDNNIFIDVPLNPATTYYWQVTATDGKGGATSSDIWSFTTS